MDYLFKAVATSTAQAIVQPTIGCKFPILGYPLLDGRQSAPV